MKDQRGTIHEYEYDKLGRLENDRVTTLGSGVDGAVRRVRRGYEFRGMLEKITAYDAATGTGTIVNEAKFTYNEFAQLIKDAQEHGGAVGTSSPAVEYDFADGADNHIRPNNLTYPNGRVLTFSYED